MVENLRHVGIVVSNIEKFKNIFINYLGITHVTDYDKIDSGYINTLVGSASENVKICVLKLRSGQKIELLEYNTACKINPTPYFVGSSHIALTVDDIENLYSKRKDFEVKFVAPPMKNPEGTVKLSYVCLGEEINLELVEILND